MKTIEVVAGIMTRETAVENGGLCREYFATQRGYGELKGLWEFPGGKTESGESREQALARELKEELDIDVSVDQFLCTVEHDYPGRHIIMHCFFCRILQGTPVLKEHQAAKWLPFESLNSLEWCPADVAVVQKLSSFGYI